MARLARVVAPAISHHITQPGNRRQPTFFCEEDHECYLELMAQFRRAEQVEIWAWRPLGDEAFLASLERNLCRILRRRKPGPKDKHPS